MSSQGAGLPRARHNSSRVYLDRFVARAARAVPQGGRVLDAGAGDERYRDHFRFAHYESADFCRVDKPYARVTYECDLGRIPVEDGRYDAVLLTQVLEHLPEPGRVLREIARVLRPQGTLWLTAPLYFPEHEAPYDFYRYTQYGLRHLLGSCGFEVEGIEWLEGYLGTLSQQMTTAMSALPLRPAAHGGGPQSLPMLALAGAAWVGLRLGAAVLSRADERFKVTSVGHPKNYAAVARKAASPRT